MELSQAQRRIRLERLLGQITKPVYLTPVTRDRSVADDWLKRFEGAGLDGVIAKPEAATYQPGRHPECSRSSTPGRRTAWSPVFAGIKEARTPWARCCWACTTR